MALRFDANTEYASRTSSVPSSTSFTMAFWAYIVSDLGAGVAQGLCWLGGSVSTDSIFFLWNNTSGVMEAGVYKASPFGIDLANPASRPAVGTWAFCFMRRSGTASNSFTVGWAAPGATSFTSATASLVGGSTPGTLSVDTMRVGTTDSTTGAANARYAGVKVWDAALTDTELLQEMATLRPVRTTNLHLWTPFIAATAADNLIDLSGNGKNWTAAGTHSVEDGPPISWGGAPILILPGAGTTYSQSASATTTPTSSVVRQTGKRVTATTTPTKTIARAISKALSTTTTPTRAIVRSLSRAFAASTTPAATLAAVRVILKTISATADATSSLARRTGKVLSQATTPPATFVRAITKRLSVATTLAATLSKIKVKLVTLSASTTPVAGLVRAIGKVLSSALDLIVSLTHVGGREGPVATPPFRPATYLMIPFGSDAFGAFEPGPWDDKPPEREFWSSPGQAYGEWTTQAPTTTFWSS